MAAATDWFEISIGVFKSNTRFKDAGILVAGEGRVGFVFNRVRTDCAYAST